MFEYVAIPFSLLSKKKLFILNVTLILLSKEIIPYFNQ